jgi:hypothetical protein
MRWKAPLLGVALAFVLGTNGAGGAEFVAKSYEFKANVRLEVGLDLDASVRLESIEFEIPDDPSGFGTTPRAKVVVSNLGETPRRIGIAIAVEDGEGRLLAAGSGGTKMFPLRGGRQMDYGVPLDDVNGRIGEATAFRISFQLD